MNIKIPSNNDFFISVLAVCKIDQVVLEFELLILRIKYVTILTHSVRRSIFSLANRYKLLYFIFH